MPANLAAASRRLLVPAALCLPLAPTCAQGLTATLTANDPVYARRSESATGMVLAEQTHPAGPLASTSLGVPGASYTCTFGPEGEGYRLEASTQCGISMPGLLIATHADLTMVVNGPSNRIASIDLEINHFGDFSAADGFRVDFGDDGSFEVSSGGSPPSSGQRIHRLWTWDFADGPLPIRIRTDQIASFGPQAYTLDLDAELWAAEGSPTGPDCGGIALRYNGSFAETTNYQLAVEAPPGAGQLAELRATGMGIVGAFFVAGAATVQPLTLPPPFVGTCDVLDSVLWLDFATVSASTSASGATPIPREWRLTVPALPPGLTFHLQHVSAEPSVPTRFGASNRVRIDT